MPADFGHKRDKDSLWKWKLSLLLGGDGVSAAQRPKTLLSVDRGPPCSLQKDWCWDHIEDNDTDNRDARHPNYIPQCLHRWLKRKLWVNVFVLLFQEKRTNFLLYYHFMLIQNIFLISNIFIFYNSFFHTFSLPFAPGSDGFRSQRERCNKKKDLVLCYLQDQ